MKTARFSWFYPHGGTGLGRAAHSMTHALAENGCTPTLFSAAHPLGARKTLSGITLIGCAAPHRGLPAWMRRRAGLGQMIGPWFFRKAVVAEHAQAGCDTVEATNRYAAAALIGPCDVPVIIRNSTPAIDAAPQTPGPREKMDMAAAHGLERRNAPAR